MGLGVPIGLGVLMGWGVPIGLGVSLWGTTYGDPTSHTTPQIVSPIEDECHGGGAMGWGGLWGRGPYRVYGGFMGLGVTIGKGGVMGLGVLMGWGCL